MNPSAPSTSAVCQAVAARLLEKQWMLCTAESCTGGLIAATCTDLAGASAWLEGGFVSYSNAAKSAMLGVSPALVERYGAVSQEVALAMAQGACARSGAQVGIAVTGIAGPSGGSAAKLVGTVWFAWVLPHAQHSAVQHFSGDRAAVRHATVLYALSYLAELLQAW